MKIILAAVKIIVAMRIILAAVVMVAVGIGAIVALYNQRYDLAGLCVLWYIIVGAIAREEAEDEARKRRAK